MAQKARSVQLSPTAYAYCEALVSTGQYATIDDAATDLIMQVRRGTVQTTAPSIPTTEAIKPVLPSTPPVLDSTDDFASLIANS